MKVFKELKQVIDDCKLGLVRDPLAIAFYQVLGGYLPGIQLMKFDHEATMVLRDLARSFEDAGNLPSAEYLPFEKTFIELEDGQAGTWGVMFVKNDDGAAIMSIGHRPGLTLNPTGYISFIDSQGEMKTKSMMPALVDRWNRMDPNRADEYFHRAARVATFALFVMTVFSTLRRDNDVLLEEAERVYSRSERRRADRGKDSTTSIEKDQTFTNIRLGEIGRRHAEAMVGDGPSSRRSHWVRGHMFLARNGRMTWRRPHIRGTGEVHDTVRSVTAGGAVAAK